MTHAHETPASFYASPEEAIQAPPEEFLYVALLRPGGEQADFDRRRRRRGRARAPRDALTNADDELHHFGWNRCSSACHGPDRSHLIVPGFRSSRVYILNVADDPRRPRIEKIVEPEELVAATGYTRPHTVHCMPGENVVISMLGDADGNGAGGFAVLDAKTFEVKGRWENGGERPPFNYDFWYQPRKNVLVSSRVRRAERLRARVRPRRRPGRPLRTAAPLLEPRGADASSRRSTSARTGSSRWRCAGSTTRRPRRASSAPRSRARCGASTARTARGRRSR